MALRFLTLRFHITDMGAHKKHHMFVIESHVTFVGLRKKNLTLHGEIQIFGKINKNKHQLSTLENPSDIFQTSPQKFNPFQPHTY